MPATSTPTSSLSQSTHPYGDAATGSNLPALKNADLYCAIAPSRIERAEYIGQIGAVIKSSVSLQ
jgi:hypothetical protein